MYWPRLAPTCTWFACYTCHTFFQKAQPHPEHAKPIPHPDPPPVLSFQWRSIWGLQCAAYRRACCLSTPTASPGCIHEAQGAGPRVQARHAAEGLEHQGAVGGSLCAPAPSLQGCCRGAACRHAPLHQPRARQHAQLHGVRAEVGLLWPSASPETAYMSYTGHISDRAARLLHASHLGSGLRVKPLNRYLIQGCASGGGPPSMP